MTRKPTPQIWQDGNGKKYIAITDWVYSGYDSYNQDMPYPTMDSETFIPVASDFWECKLVPIDTPIYSVRAETLPQEPFKALSTMEQERVKNCVPLGNVATHYNKTVEQVYNSYVREHETEYINDCEYCWCEELYSLTLVKEGE